MSEKLKVGEIGKMFGISPGLIDSWGRKGWIKVTFSVVGSGDHVTCSRCGGLGHIPRASRTARLYDPDEVGALLAKGEAEAKARRADRKHEDEEIYQVRAGGKTWSEVALMFGISIGTAKHRARRGKLFAAWRAAGYLGP